MNSKIDWHFNESRQVIENLYPHFVSREKDRMGFKLDNRVIFLRTNSSDFAVYNQIYIQKEYRILIDFFQKFDFVENTMIDCGGNIGLTSLLFKTTFPNLQIDLFEPNSKNSDLAKINLQSFQSINFHLKAVYTKETTLFEDYSFRLGTTSSFRYVETPNQNPCIQAANLLSFVEKYNYLDFLKIDIEGGEKALLEDVEINWLENVRVVAVEIHDEIVDRFKIQNNLTNWGFVLTKYGEYTIGFNSKMMEESFIRDFILHY